MKRHWLSIFGVFLGVVCGMGAQEMPPPPDEVGDPPPPPLRQSEKRGERSGRDERLIWRAFSEMSEAERRSMHELRMKNEAAYKKALAAKVESIRVRDRAETEAMQKLIAAWKAAPESEKAKFRAEVRTRIATHYNERLAENRRRLEEMRRRTEKLSLELTRREVEAAKNIDAITDVVLEKGFPPPPPAGRQKPKKMQ